MIHTIHLRRLFFLMTVIFAALTACTSAVSEPPADPLTTPITKPTADDPTPTVEPVVEPADPLPLDTAATIDSLEVIMLTTFPVQAEAIVSGYFPNGCWSFDRVKVEEIATTFVLTVFGKHSGADMCTEALVPFAQVVPLPIEGLAAGVYIVESGNQGKTFTLLTGNSMGDVVVTVEAPRGVENLDFNLANIAYADVSVNDAEDMVIVNLSGSLSDGCTYIYETIIEEPKGNTIAVTVTTARDQEMMCTMALVDYEHSFDVLLKGIHPDDLVLIINGTEFPQR